jgi:hypothetical protein
MKKALDNLKKTVPPKARIAILAAFGGISVVSYLLYSVLSSGEDDIPAQNGLTKVETVIEKETRVEKNNLIAKDNSINKQIADLEKKNIESMKSSDEDVSYFGGIDLSKGKSIQEEDDAEMVNSDVVDLSAMFNETEEEKEERESKKKERIEDIGSRLDIPQPQPQGVLFNRDEYLSEIRSSIINNANNNDNTRWEDLSASQSLVINDYSSSNETKSSELTSTNNSPIGSESNSNLKSLASQKRSQYVSRYNEMKTDLEKRINGNISNVASSEKAKDDDSSLSDSNGESKYPSNKTYGAGEIIYAINDIEIVSSETNIVRVTIAENGDTYGAILLGEFTQIGDVLGVSFNSYTVDGKSYSIEATAIDAKTWKSGLADDVDNHYFSRYFGIIAAAMLEGYAETLTNSSQTNTESGITESQERIESSSERLRFAIGRVGEYLAPKFLEDVDRASTVSVFRDKELGIMFMSDFRVPARK